MRMRARYKWNLIKSLSVAAGSKSGVYEVIREKLYTKLLANGSLLLQNVREDREGFYSCQAQNGIGTGIGKVIQLKVNGKCSVCRRGGRAREHGNAITTKRFLIR